MSTATLGQVTATQDASGIRILLAMDNVAARLTLEALLAGEAEAPKHRSQERLCRGLRSFFAGGHGEGRR